MITGQRVEPVVWVDAQLPPANDPVIFAAARARGAAIAITKDDDFVQLVGRHGPPPQAVWVTCGNVRNAEVRAIVLKASPRVADLLAHGEPLVELSRLA